MSPAYLFGSDGDWNVSGGGRRADDGPRLHRRRNAEGEGTIPLTFANGDRTADDPTDPRDVRRVIRSAEESETPRRLVVSDRRSQRAMSERSFYLVVTGNGSFSLGRGPTWRAGVHKVDAVTAAQVLAWKTKHPSPWLVLSQVEPVVEDGHLVGPLRPEDIRNGVADGVRFPKPKQPDPAKTPAALPTAPATTFPCHWCEREFVSAARLERHVKHNHVLKHAEVEAAVRAQLEAEDAARAADRRAGDAGPDGLRPEERKAFEG